MINEKKIDLANAFYMVDTLMERIGKKPTNEVIQLTDGYISYNPTTDTGEETAVVKNNKFFILLGDYREQLKNCKNTNECVKVYKELMKNGAKVSLWSNYE